jgi:hypothetical protein
MLQVAQHALQEPLERREVNPHHPHPPVFAPRHPRLLPSRKHRLHSAERPMSAGSLCLITPHSSCSLRLTLRRASLAPQSSPHHHHHHASLLKNHQ